MVIEKSPFAIVRDILFVGLVAVALMVARSTLRHAGLVGKESDLGLDMIVAGVGTLCITIAVFALYFIIEAVFLSPYRLWREAAMNVAAAEKGRGIDATKSHEDAVRFDVWDRVDLLAIRQAACLWMETEPIGFSATPTTTQQVMIGTLVGAIDRGELIPEPLPDPDENIRAMEALFSKIMGPFPKYTKDSKVSRANLKAYAEHKGERPKFLFKDAR